MEAARRSAVYGQRLRVAAPTLQFPSSVAGPGSSRGVAQVLEPVDGEECILQTIAMEIDYGPFLRVLSLPDDIDVDKTKAEQRNGFLWITLPFNKS